MKLIKLYKIALSMSICLMGAVSFGQNVFIDKTSEFGLELGSSQIAFVDYNNDSWVDIWCFCHPLLLF